MRVLAVLFAVVAFLSASAAEAQTGIQWRVKDRFRLWDQAQNSSRVVTLDTLLDQVAAARRPGEVERAMLGFLATQADLYQKAYWREGEETYDRDYLWPTTYAGRASLPEAAGRICVWSIDVGVVTTVASPCERWVDFEVPAVARDSAVRRSLPANLRVSVDGWAPRSARVEIRDRLIASIGDSFASGEGNPDRPMDLTRVTRRFDPVEAEDGRSVIQTAWRSEWDGRWVGREDVIGRAGGARWWDQRCHRSFYSQHTVAALRYAAAHPQEATTFVTFACSGAETYRGLLGRQARPPGYAGDRQAEPLRYPQLEVLAANLCPRRLRGLSRDSTRAGEARTYPYWDWRDGELRRRSVTEWSWTCTNGIPRRVDALLVSVGGNDVGFGPVIQDALLPRPEELPADANLGRWVLDILRERQALTPDQAGRRIREALPENLDQLRGRVEQLFGHRMPVFQTAYPNPLQDETGELCGPGVARSSPADNPHSRALAAVGGFWPDADVQEVRRWRMIIHRAEAEAVQSGLIAPLDRALRDHIDEGAGQWRLVDGFQPAFERRGWCATNPDDLLETLALPNWGDRGWRDWSPQDWDPYRQRMRLFRTPNDAAMTQQPDNPRRLLGPLSGLFNPRLSRRQEALLSAMSGSFHPTFEAHAIIGWSLGEALIATPLPE
jgi:hypothetical protein